MYDREEQELKFSRKLYTITWLAAIGIPFLIIGIAALLNRTEWLTTQMATFGFIATGLISGYAAYKIATKLHKDKQREQDLIVAIWNYHEEHPRATPNKLVRDLGVDFSTASKILAEIKYRKEQGEKLVLCKGRSQFYKSENIK
jgi:hypothetical protein